MTNSISFVGRNVPIGGKSVSAKVSSSSVLWSGKVRHICLIHSSNHKNQVRELTSAFIWNVGSRAPMEFSAVAERSDDTVPSEWRSKLLFYFIRTRNRTKTKLSKRKVDSNSQQSIRFYRSDQNRRPFRRRITRQSERASPNYIPEAEAQELTLSFHMLSKALSTDLKRSSQLL